MADAPDLGSGALGRGGSSPLIRTMFGRIKALAFVRFFCKKEERTRHTGTVELETEGTLRQTAKDNEGKLVDIKVYSILREEWTRGKRTQTEGLK